MQMKLISNKNKYTVMQRKNNEEIKRLKFGIVELQNSKPGDKRAEKQVQGKRVRDSTPQPRKEAKPPVYVIRT